MKRVEAKTERLFVYIILQIEEKFWCYFPVLTVASWQILSNIVQNSQIFLTK